MEENKEAAVLLSVRNLVVEYTSGGVPVHAVNGVSFDLAAGKTLGLVGETGAGKTTIAKTILRILPDHAVKAVEGNIYFKGEDVLSIPEKAMRNLRGKAISMIFQDPMTALNPVKTVSDQIAESIALHQNVSKKQAHEMAVEILETVGITADRADEYPHQFSGGMKQRVVIALAIACNPELLIADEPTTALDVTIQAQVLELISKIRKELNTSLILITHDLGVVAESCDSVAVVYAGQIVESGSKEDVFDHPTHPYTKGLFAALPDMSKDVNRLAAIDGMPPDPTDIPKGCSFHPRCRYAADECRESEPAVVEVSVGHFCQCFRSGEMQSLSAQAAETVREAGPRAKKEGAAGNLIEIKNLKKYFAQSRGNVHAVDDVSFAIEEGSTMGLVGESGCGKSTLGRTLVHLLESTDGKIYLHDKEVTHLNKKQVKNLREDLQIIFQDPYSSLNPRMTVKATVQEPLILSGKYKGQELEDATFHVMELVGLEKRFQYSFPHELDGGRRQRVGIARALAVDPKFIVCDEPVSALDVSIQAQILNLLMDLQETQDLTYLFVTHNLSVVRHISDYICVMYLGHLVERCATKEFFKAPLHPYSKALLSAVPSIDIHKKRERIILKGELSSPIDPKPGCRFANRCLYADEGCRGADIPLEEVMPGHFTACRKVREVN